MPALRHRAFVLLIALAGVQLLTVTAALAGDPSCRCDASMCVHHPGQHHSAARHTAPDPVAPSVAPPASPHCAHAAAAAPRDCSMRGCEPHHDQLSAGRF